MDTVRSHYLHKLTNRYSPRVQLETQEFIEPVPDAYFIFWLFKYRCIMCKQSATEVNEIVLRSRSKFALLDYKNRVPLCSSCHRDYHKNGVTIKKQEDMKIQREEFLKSIGREIYI